MTNTAIQPANVYALVVGIEKYQAGADYDLNAPANDALDFCNWLLNHKVDPEHIYLFLSPLDKNQGILSVAEGKGMKPLPATHDRIASVIRSRLTNENNQGSLLYVFWGGHGFITKTDTTVRRLFFADTDDNNKLNLNFNSLVDALSTSAFGAGFSQQVFLIDACANLIYRGLFQNMQGKASEIKFAANGEDEQADQIILFASQEYGVATNDSSRGTGYFSRAVLERLQEKPLLPEMETIEAQIRSDFLKKQRALPASYYSKLRGKEINETILGTSLPLKRGSVLKAIGISVAVAASIATVRFFGFLQPYELPFYDYLMQSREDLPDDDRIRVIAINSSDVEAQKKRGEVLVGSVSHETLAKLLNKLDSDPNAKPIAVGLDIYRNQPTPQTNNPQLKSQYKSLVGRFRSQLNLFGVCKMDSEANFPSSAGPTGMLPDSDRMGFVDFFYDSDRVLRRHLLSERPSVQSPCKSDMSLSLRLANYYLKEKKNIDLSMRSLNEDGSCQGLMFSNGMNLEIFRPYFGGYQGEENYGACQIMLNYRDSKSSTRQFSLETVLKDDFSLQEFKGRIVLIGVAYRTDIMQDYRVTPFGKKPEDELPGVEVQAQMASQIISAVLSERPLISVWSSWGEFGWILVWSFIGAALAWKLHWLWWPLSTIVAVSVLYGSCILAFHYHYWIPFLPPAASLSITIISIKLINLHPAVNHAGKRRSFAS